jgi:hypothetical protein
VDATRSTRVSAATAHGSTDPSRAAAGGSSRGPGASPAAGVTLGTSRGAARDVSSPDAGPGATHLGEASRPGSGVRVTDPTRAGSPTSARDAARFGGSDPSGRAAHVLARPDRTTARPAPGAGPAGPTAAPAAMWPDLPDPLPSLAPVDDFDAPRIARLAAEQEDRPWNA